MSTGEMITRLHLLEVVMLFGFGVLILFPVSAFAFEYQVGPGKDYTAISDVPWESLNPGDTVLIHWRSDPYREKWVICRRGTESDPITVSGVPGPNGELPVIDGRDAVTRTALSYWNGPRSVIKIGGANTPPDTMPAYIVVENLDIRSARTPYSFTDHDGVVQSYRSNAASIYIEKGQHITINNCIIRDSGNGLFISHETSESLIQGCWVYDNGIEGSIYHHNSYTSAVGLTFQYNRYGPLRAGCKGNNLKDRSAGLVVRYNWIEGGNRQLDLVDSSRMQDNPRYRETFVYGNILIEPEGAGNSQIVHYGGDSRNTQGYRKGVLYFYNNTVISTRTGNTTLFRLSTNDERADCRNNIVYVTASGDRLAMLASAGVLNLRHNWFKPGWVHSHGDLTGTIDEDGATLVGTSPGFVDESAQNYYLNSVSECVDMGTALHPAALPDHDVRYHYVKHRASETRTRTDKLDIGAFEFADE